MALSVPNRESVWQDHRRPTALFQPVHDDGHKEIRRLAAGQVVGEVVLHIRLLAAAVGGIHQRHIELVRLGVVQHIPHQSVVVVHRGTSSP